MDTPDLRLAAANNPQGLAEEAIHEALDAQRGSLRVRLLPQLYRAAKQVYVPWSGLTYRFELPLDLERVMELRDAFEAFFQAMNRHGFAAVILALQGLDKPEDLDV